MTPTSETVVFFGSGPVAADSLERLTGVFAIEAVVSKPLPKGHKGAFPVLDLAKRKQLPVFTATDRLSLDRLFREVKFHSQVAILVDFGIIVSRFVIDSFPMGIINSHFSLLPQWRGADPISFALLSGQEKTGVSLMLLNEGLDEGPLLSQMACEITKEDNSLTLTDKLIELSTASLELMVPQWVAGRVEAVSQESFNLVGQAQPSYSRKLRKEDGELDWSKPAERLVREIRAFWEWPKSRATFDGIDVIVTEAHSAPAGRDDPKAGTPVAPKESPKMLYVTTSNGRLYIDKLKPAGKQEMSAQAFLLGYAAKLKSLVQAA